MKSLSNLKQKINSITDQLIQFWQHWQNDLLRENSTVSWYGDFNRPLRLGVLEFFCCGGVKVYFKNVNLFATKLNLTVFMFNMYAYLRILHRFNVVKFLKIPTYITW